MAQDVTMLLTEQNNPRTVSIGDASFLDVMRMIHEEDRRGVDAMDAALPTLATMAEEIASRLERGGRLFYVGAGTSGRIGVLDAAELPATYGVPLSLVMALVPGGYDTLPDARLGDEDDREGARADLAAQALSDKDAVVGIAASGRTPYTHEALVFANSVGAYTAAITNVPLSLLSTAATHTAVIETGPEAIQGSTRMKAGTTQKLALNMLSTAVMIRLGKVYRNTMVDMTAVNDKLRVRATRLVMDLTDADEETAVSTLEACEYHVKTAVAAILLRCDVNEAATRLAAHGGRLQDCL